MKIREMSWEKLNDKDEDEDNINDNIPGVVLGTISSSRNVNDYEDYNLFIAHCNFYISPNIVNFLCLVEGIESLDILSPYRFRISVGQLFSPQEVIDTIEQKLLKEQL